MGHYLSLLADMNDTQHRRPDRSSNKKLCGSATFPAAPHAKMAQSGEHFFTINGTEIALSIVECDSSVAIQCTIANDTERKRAIKRQLLVASGILILCTIFNLSPAHPLTIACIGWLLYLLHGAAYLIEYGNIWLLFSFDGRSLCVRLNCLVFRFFGFRKSRCTRFSVRAMHNEILVETNAYVHSHQAYPRHCHQRSYLWGECGCLFCPTIPHRLRSYNRYVGGTLDICTTYYGVVLICPFQCSSERFTCYKY